MTSRRIDLMERAGGVETGSPVPANCTGIGASVNWDRGSGTREEKRE